MVKLNKRKIFFIIPAYNEGSKIKKILMKIQNCGFTPVVIDDSSKDNTSFEVAKTNATLIKHSINLGQGAALQTGFDFSIMKNADMVVTFDSDGQHSLDDAKKLIEFLVMNEDYDVAIGSRFIKKNKNIPFAKLITLKLAILFEKLVYKTNYTDAHNGLRAIRSSALKKIQIEHNRMAHASELTNQFNRNKFKIKELPVNISYTTYSKNKGQKISNSLNIIKDLLIGGFQ